LFLVTNTGNGGNLRFSTTSVERWTHRGWEQFPLTNAWLPGLAPINGRYAQAEQRAVASNAWRGIGGYQWSEWSVGCLFAVAWPPGLPTTSTWRMQVLGAREPAGLRGRINEELGREVFPPGRECTVYSSEVVH
jgi:hypothetical protein